MTRDELLAEAALRGITPPSKRTLDKYGIDDELWLSLLARQGWVCAICQRTGRKWNTDHEHVPGWVKKPPEHRAIYVRGILCWMCNRHSVPSNMTAAEGQRVADYLREYELRREAAVRAFDPSAGD